MSDTIKLLMDHAEAKDLHDKDKCAKIEREIAGYWQKRINIDLDGKFHCRVVLYPGARPRKGDKT